MNYRSAAWSATRLKPGPKLLLISICDGGNADGENLGVVSVNLNSLVFFLDESPPTVERYVNTLVHRGYMVETFPPDGSPGNGSTWYQLTIDSAGNPL